MANCDDIENPSPSTSSNEQDAEKLHSATSLINALQETADLLSSYVKESSSNFLEPSCSNIGAASTNSNADDFSEPSASCSNTSSTQGKCVNQFADISVGQLVQYIVETEGASALTLADDDTLLSRINPVQSWEENANDQALNDDEFCFNISQESITKSTCIKYNSPSNDTLKDYFVEVDMDNPRTEDPTTSEHNEEIEMNNISANIEATISTMERELRKEASEHKKSKLLNLPTENSPDSPNQCEIMGDDATKNNVHILCECDQPGVAGAAVPVITSFTSPDESKIPKCPSLTPKLSDSFKTDKLARTVKNHLIGEDKADPKVSKKNIRFKTDSAALLKKEVSKEKTKYLRFENEENKRQFRELTKEFSEYVSQLAKEASNLPKTENSSAQSIAIDTIYKYVKNLNKITKELKAMQSKPATDIEQSQDSKSKIKDRVFIKFLPSKCGQSCDCHDPSNSNNRPTSRKAVPNKDSVESMDGIFIPSFDEPAPSLEDEVDEEGLGITITFPKNETFNENGCSHVSVCFADVSAESLKRCPKKCTLHMDFAKRKMVFQSGKSVNNYVIVPDLKVTECIIDHKKSEILCIMRPNECLYPSQLIPVEGLEGTSGINDSFKLLRSTNSELLNIVGLPSANANKRKSLLTKSCTSIKSNIQRIVSEVDQWRDQISTKSMPHIPVRK